MAKKGLIFLILLLLALPVFAADTNTSLEKGAVEVEGHWIGLNWPLQGEGRKSSSFGNRKHPILGVVRAHGGVDIAAPKGTPVLASLGGRVSKAGDGGDLGKHVVIDHPNGRQTTYGHLSEIGVKAGQFVNPRQVVGKVGSTGLSTGPHLHFAVRQNGKTVDPERWIVPTGYLKFGKAADKSGKQEKVKIDWFFSKEGVKTSSFGFRVDPILGVTRAHGGLDIAAKTGTNVLSVLDGIVLRTGEGGDLGKHVYVDHGDGVVSIYGHLSKIEVKANQSVFAGDLLGNVGSTGRSTGPHLHFAIKQNGKLIDPEKWMLRDEKEQTSKPKLTAKK